MVFHCSGISCLAIYLCPCTVFHDRMVGVTRDSISLQPQGGVRITTRGVLLLQGVSLWPRGISSQQNCFRYVYDYIWCLHWIKVYTM